jgi:hypothetical protein
MENVGLVRLLLVPSDLAVNVPVDATPHALPRRHCMAPRWSRPLLQLSVVVPEA